MIFLQCKRATKLKGILSKLFSTDAASGQDVKIESVGGSTVALYMLSEIVSCGGWCLLSADSIRCGTDSSIFTV